MNRKRSTALSRRIFKSYLIIGGINFALCLILLVITYIACQFAPRLINRNYMSIVAVRNMSQGWRYNNPEQFERGLAQQKNSISEEGEQKVTDQIEAFWRKNKKKIGKDIDSNNKDIVNLFRELIKINEEPIFLADKSAKEYENLVVTLGVMMTFFMVGATIVLSSRVSANLLKDLTNEEQKLMAVLSNVEDGVLVLSENNKIIHCNLEMRETLNIDKNDQIAGENWESLKKQTDNYKILKSKIGKKQTHQIVELTQKDRKSIYNLRSRPIFDGENSIGIVHLLHNITESHQQEILKKEFIGVLSHELKTPLQSLSTAVELLSEERNKLSAHKQFLMDTIDEDIIRIKAVANDFLHLSLGEIHSVNLKFEIVNIVPLMFEWIKHFQVLAKDKGIELNIEGLPQVETLVKLDKIKFPWVISNILSNSLRMTPRNGKIKVNLSKTDQNLLMRFEDEGPGISREIQDKIFESYFHGESNDPDCERGLLGIGLTISRDVLVAHGGQIKIPKHVAGDVLSGAVIDVSLPLFKERAST